MLGASARAKVNLFLHVGARRDDGFHALESLIVFVDVADELTFEPADTLSLSLSGPFAAALANEPDNLVLRAARVLADRMQVHEGAHITLAKNLPVASGIGGGSADAAAALRGLTQLWRCDAKPETMHEIALTLGSDVPVCLASTPAWMTGRGEHVEAVNLRVKAAMVLVNPGIAISTPQIFASLDERTGLRAIAPPEVYDVKELCFYLRRARNDLQEPARELAPVIGDVVDALSGNGALLARMSGSGATCFGIFEDDAIAQKAAAAISKSQPGWWVKPTRF